MAGRDQTLSTEDAAASERSDREDAPDRPSAPDVEATDPTRIGAEDTVQGTVQGAVQDTIQDAAAKASAGAPPADIPLAIDATDPAAFAPAPETPPIADAPPSEAEPTPDNVVPLRSAGPAPSTALSAAVAAAKREAPALCTVERKAPKLPKTLPPMPPEASTAPADAQSDAQAEAQAQDDAEAQDQAQDQAQAQADAQIATAAEAAADRAFQVAADPRADPDPAPASEEASEQSDATPAAPNADQPTSAPEQPSLAAIEAASPALDPAQAGWSEPAGQALADHPTEAAPASPAGPASEPAAQPVAAESAATSADAEADEPVPTREAATDKAQEFDRQEVKGEEPEAKPSEADQSEAEEPKADQVGTEDLQPEALKPEELMADEEFHLDDALPPEPLAYDPIFDAPDPVVPRGADLKHPDMDALAEEFEHRRSANTAEDFIDRHKLGEFLHGARATLGHFNLKDVERKLKIKARYLEAIETVDLARLPRDAYIPGYVRAYIRFLASGLPEELTPKRAYEKFLKELDDKRAESGEEPLSAPTLPGAASNSMSAEALVAARIAQRTQATQQRAAKKRAQAAEEAARRRPAAQTAKASASKAPARVSPAIVKPLGVTREEIRAKAKTATQAWNNAEAAALAGLKPSLWEQAKPFVALSAMALVLVGGVYGLWVGFSSAQRVIGGGADDLTVIDRRDGVGLGAGYGRAPADAYRPGGVLTRVYEPPKTERSDGPISEIDPRTVGAYAQPTPRRTPPSARDPRLDNWLPPSTPVALSPAVIAERARVAAAQAPAVAGADGRQVDPPLGPQATASGASEPVTPTLPPPAFAVRAVEEIWVSVQSIGADGVRRPVFEGVLAPGEMAAIPRDAGPLRLRTGNAGGTVLVVDGAAYGPIGRPGRVRTVRDLTPAAVPAAFDRNPELTQRIADEAVAGAYRGPIAPAPAAPASTAPTPIPAAATTASPAAETPPAAPRR